MGSAANKKLRQTKLQSLLAKNPFLTDENLAEQFEVSIQTIRLDREYVLVAVPATFPVNESLKEYRLTQEQIADRSFLKEQVPRLPLSLLKEEPFLLLKDNNDMCRRAMEMCGRAGFDPRVALRTDQMLTAWNIARAGQTGVTFFRDTILRYTEPTDRLCYYYPDDEPDLHTGKTPLGNAQAAFDAAEYTADHIGSPDSHLFIHGPTGVGKTFLAHCIAKQALDSSKPALVLSASEFVEILEKATFGHDETFKDTSNSLLTCDVLVIDDLGTEFVNSFVLKELFRVLVHRIENNKTTVISTNLSLPEIRDLYSERIFSRIMSQFNIIKLTGDDIRLAKKLSGGESDTAI